MNKPRNTKEIESAVQIYPLKKTNKTLDTSPG